MKYITEITYGKKTMVSLYEKKKELMRDIDLLKYYYPNKKKLILCKRNQVEQIDKLINN